MSDQNELTPQGTINSPTTQPQVDPAAPQGTPAPDNQPTGITETPEQKAQREAFYQTKYQDEKKRADDLEVSLTELKQNLQFNPYVPPSPQAPPAPGQVQQTQTPDFQLPEGIDPLNNPVEYARWLLTAVDRTVSRAAENAIVDTTTKVARQTRVQTLRGQFFQWAKSPQVDASDELLAQVQGEYAARFALPPEYARQLGLPPDTLLGSPDAAVEWMAERIKTIKQLENTNKMVTQMASDGVSKAKQLAGVAQPAAGQAPSPTPSQNQQQQAIEAVANTIAPESKYGVG